MTNGILLSQISLEDIIDQMRKMIREEIALQTKADIPATTDEYLSRKQIAEKLHVTPRTIQDWTRTGKLRGHRVGRRILYKPADIAELIKPIRVSA